MTPPGSRGEARRQAATAAPPPDTCTPADRYGALFVAVQQAVVFPDSKTFVDCAPLHVPEEIVAAYAAQRERKGFDLRAFVHAHFQPPAPMHSGFRALPGEPMAAHIDRLWAFLTREPRAHPRHGSLLPLPHAYVVPGGRFAELYYWDSYFTMLGFADCDGAALVHAMTDNFAWLIDTHGHVPNGTRTYYLSRSQPPVFALMTRLCEACGGPPAVEYLPQLLAEHRFWMDGAEALAPGQAHRRVVMLPGGQLLNRYWDDRCTPREESWREDVATAAASGRPAAEVYRHLRAAAESGWDFSTRWLAECEGGPPLTALASIRTTDLLPVDLNAFLCLQERTIARLAQAAGQQATARAFERRADARAQAIEALCWDGEAGWYVDYDAVHGRRRRALTAAAVVPLFFGIAPPEHARRVADALRARLLAPGGLGTTEHASGEQWDRPNGWAPLQWMAVEGLRRYGLDALADEIRGRWLATVQAVYAASGKLVEKYALRPLAAQQATGGGGGEYPLQDGFGWTSGVTRRWLEAAPPLQPLRNRKL